SRSVSSVGFWSKGSRRNNFTFCAGLPGPLARRERRAIPGAVCEERATKPAGTAPRSPVGRSPKGRGGEGRVSALLPLLDDVRHRLRRGASHLQYRRSRQDAPRALRFVETPGSKPDKLWMLLFRRGTFGRTVRRRRD